MAANIPEAYKDLFQKTAFANLATLMADGRPQVTPVWFDFDGSHIRINSAKGRVKDKNMRRNKKVALSITDPDNPYRHSPSNRPPPRTGKSRNDRDSPHNVPRDRK